MIEIEKKFKFTSNQEKLLTQEGDLIHEKVIFDRYYDNKNYDLTRQNYWLRQRDNLFELKVPVNFHKEIFFDTFLELTDEDEIKRKLGFQFDTCSLEEILIKNEYKSYFAAETNRKSYTINEFRLDLDIVEFDTFKYRIGEIELLLNNKDKNQSSLAIHKIVQFAKDRGLVLEKVRGKVLEYLFREKPDQYKIVEKFI